MKRFLAAFIVVFFLIPFGLGAEATPVTASREGDSAEDNYWKALVLLNGTKAEELSRGRVLLQEAADMEFHPAQFYLGLCLQDGRSGFPKTPQKAVTWYRLSAERGNVFAMCYLGLCYMNASGVRKDADAAAKWENAALSAAPGYNNPVPPPEYAAQLAQLGMEERDTLSGETPVNPVDQVCATAHLVLGDLATKEGKNAEAQDHYLKAANMGAGGRAGLAQAASKAAINYAFGTGIPRDMRKASELLDLSKSLLQRSASSQAHSMVKMRLLDDFAQADMEEDISKANEQQYLQTQLQIAGSFADPKSKSYDPKEAAKWFELAASGGQPWAMVSLAFLYADGKLGQAQPEKAFEWFKQAAENGKQPLGMANLAICYENGIGTPRDHSKAAEMFGKNSSWDAVCYLGSIGKCPKNIVTLDQEIELLTQWATEFKDPQAMYILSSHLLAGYGVKQNRRKAISWLKKAAKHQHGPSLVMLGLFCRSMPEDMNIRTLQQMQSATMDYSSKAAAAGDARGHAMLGNLYHEGFGVIKDNAKAAACYERCLETTPDNSSALNNLAVIYQEWWAKAHSEGSFILENLYRGKMLEYYRRADAQNLALAALNLGCLYFNGLEGKPDYQQAYMYFERAANEGDAMAHRRLGEMHEQGVGVPVTYRDAAYHYRLGALLGDTECLRRLCDFYLQGKGVSRDYERASFWLARLVASGDRTAIINYATVLVRKQDYENAVKLLKQMEGYNSSIERGMACYLLSSLYAEGHGVKRDPGKANAYWSKAFALDNPEALHDQAIAYIKQGNYAEAMPLLRKAVQLASGTGHTQSFFTLGCLLMEGKGVEKNTAEAWLLLRQAAKKGNIDAQYTLALSTLKQVQGAPSLEEALGFVELAEAGGHSKAALVRSKLEALREKSERPATQEAEARSL
jgi:TPR repeat protein